MGLGGLGRVKGEKRRMDVINLLCSIIRGETDIEID